MSTGYYTRPLRRPPEEETEDMAVEQDSHAPYLHPNCSQCEAALSERIADGSLADEAELLPLLNEASLGEAEAFALYRHFHPLYLFQSSRYDSGFVPVALPRKRLRSGLRTGDAVLLRNILSDKTHQVLVVTSALFTHEVTSGYTSNSQKPGVYVKAYGNLSGNGNDLHYIRITDGNNRLLDNVIILRKAFPLEATAESIAETSTGKMNVGDFSPNRNTDVQEPETGAKHDDVKGRTRWFYATRISPDREANQIPYYSIASAKLRQRSNQRNVLVAMESADISETSPGGPGTNNWTPLGPSVIANGQATTNPPVSGRIISIAASTNGDRVYVGTANGGVWYSGNRGNNWEPWLGYNPTSRADYDSGNEADSLSVGAIAVIFGSSKTEDEVYVGTGEPNGNIDAYFGVGIKHYSNRRLRLEANRELAGRAVYKIVIDPSSPSRPLAATSIGLFRRRSNGRWDNITVSPTARGQVTDVIVTGSGASRKYYVAFLNDKVYQGNADMTTWTPVNKVNSGGTVVPYSGLRMALAAGSHDPAVVYALDAGNELYKFDGSVLRQVSGVPRVFNGGGGQGWYDIILAVDPARDDTVYLGGDYLQFPAGGYDLSLYKGTVGGTPLAFSLNTAPAGSTPKQDSRFIGTGIHPDGHAIAFSRDGRGNVQVWVGCDGGVFYNDALSTAGRFISKNTGLGTAQLNYVTQWQQTDAVVIGGVQDNGILRHLGSQVWWEGAQGDGGGVAIDPNNEFNIMGQKFNGHFVVSNDAGVGWSSMPALSLDPNNISGPNSGEFQQTPFAGPLSSFYPSHDGKTMVVLCTDRLWLSYNWGGAWRSLPANNTTDRFVTIVAVKIASANKIFAATRTIVFLYERTAGNTWRKTLIPNPSGLPVGALITSLDVDDAATGSFYIALGGVGRFERCHYYDGTTWHKAGPPVDTLNIPCHAIVVDPTRPRNIYLGSDVGVWKGVRNGNAWTLRWTLYSEGLPEAAITDLKIHSGARLLRAATHGRGIWEIAIDNTTGNAIDLYLRTNYADSGRMQGGRRFSWVRTAQDPTRTPTGVSQPVALNMSPDIKVRRASLPPLTQRVNYYDFEANLGEQVRNPNWQRGDLAGTNQVFIQVHTRGLDIIRGTNIRVMLLMANATSGTSPDLPAGFTSRINAGDTDPRWLSGSQWKFADGVAPFKVLAANLNVRTPQVIRFDVRFSDLSGLTASSKVALLAFVTTINRDDGLTGTAVRIEDLIMTDKHVAQRYVVFA